MEVVVTGRLDTDGSGKLSSDDGRVHPITSIITKKIIFFIMA
jgi:hypothetical protein